MSLSELSIRRPVFATVMSLVLVLVGLMAYSRLTVREYPNIDEPVVSVSSTYQGASADIIESQITQPLEEVLSGIEGLDVITSSSRPGRSQINLRFRINRDPEDAAADVRDRVAQARGRLPDDVDEPTIRKVEADSQPVIYLALAAERLSPIEVTDVADTLVKDRLQNLPGVAEVRIFGERSPRCGSGSTGSGSPASGSRRRTSSRRCAARTSRFRPADREPEARVRDPGRDRPAHGRAVQRPDHQGGGRLPRPPQGHRPGRDRAPRRAGAVPLQRHASVAVGVVKQSTANPLDVSEAVKAELPKIAATLPEGVSMEIGYDSSIFIAASIDNVFHAVAEAVGLVVLVIFFFLRSFRATLVPLVTIPVSLVGAFTLMWAFGFSINTLTLLAMVLAVGLVVDDAIVMLENISRHVEAGMKPREAALKGSREIAFAIVAMTITLAAVYAPIAFQTGRTGRLFIEFALTLAGAVLVSGFVALTLSPMMCSLLLRHGERHGVVYRAIEGFLERPDPRLPRGAPVHADGRGRPSSWRRCWSACPACCCSSTACRGSSPRSRTAAPCSPSA
jgi:multidrug efflux pump